MKGTVSVEAAAGASGVASNPASDLATEKIKEGLEAKLASLGAIIKGLAAADSDDADVAAVLMT